MNWGRDLRAKIPGAPNFRYGEFVKSDTAIRHGIINMPDNTEWGRIEILAKRILQPVRAKFGRIRITSGFRTPELCIKLGSTRKSSHTFGMAADFEPVSVKIRMFDIVDWMYESLNFDTLIAEYWPEGWIHCSYVAGTDRHRLKIKDPNHNYELVDFSDLKRIYG